VIAITFGSLPAATAVPALRLGSSFLRRRPIRSIEQRGGEAMAFGRGRESGEFQTSPIVSAAPEPGGLTAFIDQGSSFEGKLSFKDTVRIDGQFSGQITSENTLVVGESGVIEADIRAQTVIVSGTIHGNLMAGKRVVLHKSARVDGDVETPSLVMEEGSVLNGKLNMASAGPKKPLALKAMDGGGEKSKSLEK
jgi:cytoskeletal protein CcmA (bactofilin family)